MELNVLETSKNKLVLQIKGVGHTFCNNLKSELWNDSSVNVAGYVIEHPLIGIPKLVVETDGKREPKKAVLDAVSRIKSNNKEFLSSYKKIK